MNRVYNESLSLIAEDRIQQIGHDAGGRVRASLSATAITPSVTVNGSINLKEF